MSEIKSHCFSSADFELISRPAEFVFRGDSQFYSLGEINKTGLGSSAAMTSAFVTSLVKYFKNLLRMEFSPCLTRRLCYNIALKSHNEAQGKIGSGFDIAAAFYGSMWFRKQKHSEFFDLFKFPPFLTIAMGDVNKGSKTPGMVRKIMGWREKNKKECQSLWLKIDKNNQLIRSYMEELNKKDLIEKYDSPIITQIKNCFIKNREFYREMGRSAMVEIEPECQTKILDLTDEIPGVVSALVPGAGGCDAIAAIIFNDKNVREKVKDLWDVNDIKMIEIEISNGGINFQN